MTAVRKKRTFAAILLKDDSTTETQRSQRVLKQRTRKKNRLIREMSTYSTRRDEL